MKPINTDTLVTVMGGAAAANNASWITPLSTSLTSPAKPWGLASKGWSWTTR